MENGGPVSTYKSEYLNPEIDRPVFVGSAPPVGFGAQRTLERRFREAGSGLLKRYRNQKIQTIMLPLKYNDNLAMSPATADPLEDYRFTRKKYLVESNSPRKVMPRLYPEALGKRMEDFYLLFNLQLDYFKDYTKELPKYSYFKTGGHPFTRGADPLIDFSSSYPRKMYQNEKYFLTKNVERQGPSLPRDYTLAGYRDATTTAFKY